MYNNTVVGFDAREMWLDVNQQWPQAKRGELLLKQDIVKPLSVDSYIWYSVFSEISTPRLWSSVVKDPKYDTSEWKNVFSDKPRLAAPDNYRPRRVWRNLDTLEDYLSERWGKVWKPCYVVGVVEVFSDEVEEEETTAEPIIPSIVDSKWQLLGYDVADYELYTGLFNGAINLSEAAKLRNEWNDYLNEYHLFKEPEQAFAYISIANSRYPSHMPYYVYGLYLIRASQ